MRQDSMRGSAKLTLAIGHAKMKKLRANGKIKIKEFVTYLKQKAFALGALE